MARRKTPRIPDALLQAVLQHRVESAARDENGPQAPRRTLRNLAQSPSHAPDHRATRLAFATTALMRESVCASCEGGPSGALSGMFSAGARGNEIS